MVVALVENTPSAWDARAGAPTSWEAGLQSQRAQQARFAAVVENLKPLGLVSTLLDFGCGTGELCERIPGWISYTGCDWSTAMVERARRDHPGRTFRDHVVDGDRFDAVVAVGTFNLADNWSPAETCAMLARLWRMTGSLLLVSLLRQGDAPHHAHEHEVIRYSPPEVADWCVRIGIERFAIDCSYLQNDFLLVARR